MSRYFCVTFVLLCMSFCNCQLQVTITPSVQTGEREGQNLTLKCQVQNLNGRIVEWVKGSMAIASNPQKYQLTANSTTGEFSLTILNLTRNKDSNTYYCAVFNTQSDVPLTFLDRKGVQVNVFYFPDLGNPACSGQTVIQEGIPQTFRCQSQPGEPEVVPEWRRDKGVVITDNINTLIQLENGFKISEYTITPSKSDFGDNVTCKISSTAFSEQVSTCSIGPLVVNYGPSDVAITEGPFSSNNITYNNSLLCAATAFPPEISYNWSFSSPLNSSQVVIADDNQTLVILDDILCKTQITATCTATNQIGSNVADFILCTPPPPTTTTAPPTTTSAQPTKLSPSTAPPTTPQVSMDSEPKGTSQPTVLTPAILAVIAGGAMLLLATIIGLTYIAVTRRDDSTDKDHEDIEQIYNNRNVRALSIAYNEDGAFNEYADTAFDNPTRETGTGIQNGMPEDLKEPIKNNNELSTFLNTETSPTSDQEEKHDEDMGSKTEEAEKQGEGASSDNGSKASDDASLKLEDAKTSMDTPESDEDNNKGSDEDEGGIKDEQNDDDAGIPSNQDAGIQDDEDAEEMIDPILEDEAKTYHPDPRKSLVQEALLAVNVSNPTNNTARGGFKLTSEMEF